MAIAQIDRKVITAGLIVALIGLILTALIGGILISEGLANPDWSYKYFSASTNVTEAMELQHVLNQAHYPHDYVRGYYDCSDMSILCQQYLHDAGYTHVTTLVGQQTTQPDGTVWDHMWILVGEDDGWLAVECIYSPTTKMGEVMWTPAAEKYFTGKNVDDPLLYVAAGGETHLDQYSLEDLVRN